MKKIFIVVGIVIALIALYLFIFVSPPRFILEFGLPPIARDLPPNFKDADREFNQRVEAQFAVGMSEADLLLKLTQGGFKPAVDSKTAFLSRRNLVCTLDWVIDWKTDARGVVTAVQGNYNPACL